MLNLRKLGFNFFIEMEQAPDLLPLYIQTKFTPLNGQDPLKIPYIGIVPLIGTCSEEHMKEDLEIFNFDLPISVTQEIASLFN
jgi:hypothetical protein